LKKITLFLFLALSLHSFPVFAGQGCEERVAKSDNLVHALSFTSDIIQELNKFAPNDNQVVLIGRMGQDLSKYNQKYSHGGYAYKENGNWIIKHELNICSSDESALFEEGIGNFFLDDMYKYETIIISFKEPYNTNLLKLLKDNSLATKMHYKKYNLLAYPFSTKYQNSNGWLIETFALSLIDSESRNSIDRQGIQDILKNLSYEPSHLKIGAFIRLGARITKANVAFDDQPFAERMAGNIQVVTFDGIIDFFDQKGFIDKKLEFKE
jgi:hypothetical protein